MKWVGLIDSIGSAHIKLQPLIVGLLFFKVSNKLFDERGTRMKVDVVEHHGCSFEKNLC
jgi:hypothetical protein